MILYPGMTFLFKTEASVQENRNLHIFFVTLVCPLPPKSNYAEFEGAIDNALIVNKEFEQLRYYSFFINGPNVD